LLSSILPVPWVLVIIEVLDRHYFIKNIVPAEVGQVFNGKSATFIEGRVEGNTRV
jgi:hypothetical protein